MCRNRQCHCPSRSSSHVKPNTKWLTRGAWVLISICGLQAILLRQMLATNLAPVWLQCRQCFIPCPSQQGTSIRSKREEHHEQCKPSWFSAGNAGMTLNHPTAGFLSGDRTKAWVHPHLYLSHRSPFAMGRLSAPPSR